MKYIFSLLTMLFIVIAEHFAFGQSSDLAAKIDSLLKLTNPRPFNGVVIVAQESKTIYSKNIGLADIKQKTPLQLNDQFIIGSISKQVTAVLLLRELDKDRLSLQQSIRTYLPELEQSWADSVSLHQVLNHSSGIVNLDQPLAFRPGTQFSYSPILGYQLLAKIIEKTSGKAYATLADELFSQCQMKNTTIPKFYDQGRIVNSYSEEREGKLLKEDYDIKALESLTPSGGVISTAWDLVLWNACLHQDKLLKEASYQLMTSISIDRPHARWGKVGYGYGIQIDGQNKLLEYSHSGALVGFISTMIYYPAPQISIVLLENIAPDFEDMKHAFFFHDALRELVKENMLSLEKHP